MLLVHQGWGGGAGCMHRDPHNPMAEQSTGPWRYSTDLYLIALQYLDCELEYCTGFRARKPAMTAAGVGGDVRAHGDAMRDMLCRVPMCPESDRALNVLYPDLHPLIFAQS